MTVAAISGADLLILLLVLLVAIGVPIWAIVDAATRPAGAFSDTGSNKTTWIVLIVAFWLVGLGFLVGGFYLLFTRPKVRRRMEGEADALKGLL